MKIVKVRGNVKKGFDGEIGEKTLIVGPNGSGKSTIVNMVELALTGRVGDIAGKVDVAREVDVMSLATSDSLLAEVTFDTGLTASYQTSGSTSKAKKATHLPPPGTNDDVLPIRTLREALLGSPATARKFLLSKMGAWITRDMGAPQEHSDLYWALMGTVPSSVLAADALITVLEKAGEKARIAVADAKLAKQAASFVTQGASAPPSQEEIAEAKKAAAALQEAYSKAIAIELSLQNMDSLRADVEKAGVEATEAVLSFKAAQTKLEETRKPEPLGPHFDLAFRAAQVSVQEGGCIVCGNEEVDTLKESLTLGATAHNIYVAGCLAYEEANQEVGRTKSLAEFALKTLEKLEQKLREAEERASGGAPVENPEGLKAQYEVANQKVLDLQQRRAAWDSARKAQAQSQEAEEQAAQWKGLKDALENKVYELLELARSKFIIEVQSYLPSADKFDLRLRDGDREVVQFGLLRDGKLHTALSGAEWARVMAAMASACVPKGQYACIVPEERAFDAVTLGKVMRALGETPHQVILTSPVAPKSPPKDWVIIRRGEEE